MCSLASQFPNKLLTSAVSLRAALELLVQHKISGLPVVDDDGKLVSLL
jgi:CBS domain-containing protein